MSGETLPEQHSIEGLCPPLGRACIGGECPGPQYEAGIVGGSNAGGILFGFEEATIGWCGLDPVPDAVQDLRALNTPKSDELESPGNSSGSQT